MNMLKNIVKRTIPNSIIRQKLDVENCILFTFDDGPHPNITIKVLDVLDRYGAKGIFFISSSRIIRAPGILNEILNRNHGIGNHGASHTPASKMSYNEIVNEIITSRDEIFSNCGIRTEYFRPPCGIITTSLLRASWHTKHKIIRWSLSTGEYSYMKDATFNNLSNNFFNKLHDKAIVACHDDIDVIPRFLEIALPRLVDLGYDLSSGLYSTMPSSVSVSHTKGCDKTEPFAK